MTKIEMAIEGLQKFFKEGDSVTASNLRIGLASWFPNELWTVSWVSSFLQNQDLEYSVSDDRRLRTYHRPSALTLGDLQEFCNTIESTKENITKSNLKHFVRAADLPLDNFSQLFDQLQLTHNGRYTSDNHKIWVRVPIGKHLSKSKQQIVAIKDMPKPYLRNAICKYVADNGIPDMHTLLTEDNRELYKLLKAYFTFEMRTV
jgi:hypothetical protein